jgi:aconitase B
MLCGAIKEGENSVKLSDRIRACELLGKMQGDFVEKQSIELMSSDSVRDEIIARVLAGD